MRFKLVFSFYVLVQASYTQLCTIMYQILKIPVFVLPFEFGQKGQFYSSINSYFVFQKHLSFVLFFLHLYYIVCSPYCMIQCHRSVSPILSKDQNLPRPAKVKGAVLPQEYNLARFVANISNPGVTWTTNIRACDWKGVECNTDEQVEYFGLNPFDLFGAEEEDNYSGTFAWIYMPDTIKSFFMASQAGITGTLPVADLPTSLTSFALTMCNMFGPVDLTVLPPNMHRLNLKDNQFSGALDLMSLPARMGVLLLEGNRFEGSVNLSRLPVTMKHIHLRGNNIHVTSQVPHFAIL